MLAGVSASCRLVLQWCSLLVVVLVLGTYIATAGLWQWPRAQPRVIVTPADSSSVEARYQAPNKHGDWYSKIHLDDLPSWEAATWSKPWCTSLSPLYDGTFFKTFGGEVLYEPASCTLWRLSGPEARACLANKTILFVGDSVTRYQYVSFAHFLAHGVYPSRYGDDPDCPNICMEKQFTDGWEAYFQNSSAALSTSGPMLIATEHCYCNRSATKVDINTKEQRMLTVRTLGDKPTIITVVYNQTLMWPTILHAAYSALHHGLATRSVDVAVVNIGAWLSHMGRMTPGMLARGYEQLFALPSRMKQPGRMLWRTMSEGSMDRKVYDSAHVLTGMAQYYGWGLLDAAYVTQQAVRQGAHMRWDHVHFLPVMYDQWNDLLLHELCSK